MSDLVKRFYEDWHKIVDDTYDSAHLFFSDRDEAVISALGAKDRVLELGCGNGRILELCDVKEKYGIDISQIAVSNAIKRGINAKVVNIDAEDLPYESEFFDGLLAIELLEHLFDPVHALAEANRVLNKSGILIVSVPNTGYFKIRLAILFGTFNDFHGNGIIVDEHIRFYTKKSIAKLVKLCGFECQSIIGVSKSIASKNFINRINETTKKANKVTLLRKLISKAQDGTLARSIFSKLKSIFSIFFRNIEGILCNFCPSLFARGIVIIAQKVDSPLYSRNIAVDYRKRTPTQHQIHL